MYAPAAKNVTIRVNSDFFTTPLQFVKDTQGVWSATTEPVFSCAYRYNFMMDDAIVLDNRNPLTSPGAINLQSMVEVSINSDDIQANLAFREVETRLYSLE